MSTCNRTELYASVTRFHGALDDATQALADFAGLRPGELRSLCAVFFDEGAVAHTFSVAAGLDSLVIGESQILGQVRGALTLSQAHGPSALSSIPCSSRRSESASGSTRKPESARLAVRSSLLRTGSSPTSWVPWQGRRVLVVGAGAMAGLAARTAAADGASVTCANRTLAHAERLADAVGGTAVPLSDLPQALAVTDLLVTCTGARTLHHRRSRPGRYAGARNR